ncbi:MAG: ABC transporter ATP-binding protein [Nanoarchaeota archaeon]
MGVLAVEGVVKRYGNFHAVKGISFSIEKGEIVALLGSNGAGKSTTIKMLCGLLKPTDGHVMINGKTYDNDADSIKQEIGYVPEESAMYLDVGILDYLMFFARLYRVPAGQARRRIQKYLRMVDLDAGNKQIGQLSKGMKRKVLIIRSLLNDPEILIYDEPASGLDPQTSAGILKFIEELSTQGKTILFSSHNLGHVDQIASRVIIVHKGRKAFDSTVEDLKHVQRQHFVVRYRSGDTVVEKRVGLKHLKSMLDEDVVEILPEQKSIEEAFLSIVR